LQLLIENSDEQETIKTRDQRADRPISSGFEGGFQGWLHADDCGNAGVVGHVCTAEVFDDEADGDGKTGFDDPHAGRIADEE